MDRRPYATDPSDAQWAMLEPQLQRPTGPRRPATMERREVVNALLYQARTGCQWRPLPHDVPDWRAVRYCFDVWTRDGTREKVNRHLMELARQQRGRWAQPTAAIIDSQSVKSTEARGTRGFDGGEKVKGRKRHILVDPEGHLLAVLVEAVNRGDRDGARWVLCWVSQRWPELRKLWADGAYSGDVSLIIWSGLFRNSWDAARFHHNRLCLRRTAAPQPVASSTTISQDLRKSPLRLVKSTRIATVCMARL